MRRTVLSTLILIPVLAHAQSQVLVAKADPAPAVSSVSAASLPLPTHLATSTVIRTVTGEQVNANFMEAALRQGGTLEYSMRSTPFETSAPKVTRAVELDLSAQELSEQPSVSNVVVKATVDQQGIPRNAVIAQSAGSVIDKKALAAVSQYRFTPATIDNQPTWSTISIAIKIQKQ